MSCKQDTYKRLGDYIREVDVRNRDLECTNLLGLSIAKVFIPSIANTVGTDFGPYKIVKPNQFAYVPVTSRNGDKITIALYDGEEDCIISQAYTAFEVKDTNVLLPEYLMMWFKRPEFDRYARFKSHGSAREIFDWEEMCNVMMPIPDLAEQQLIVDQYNAIQSRIENNKQTIAKLEETAQAIYRKMFVDDIDPQNIPEGWKVGTLQDICEVLDSKRSPLSSEERLSRKGEYRYFGAMDIIDYVDDYIFDGIYLLFAEDGYVTDKDGHPNTQYVWGKFWLNNHAHILASKDEFSIEYIKCLLKEVVVFDLVTGAAQPKINQKNMLSIPVFIPTKNLLTEFNNKVSKLFSYYRNLCDENISLSALSENIIQNI